MSRPFASSRARGQLLRILSHVSFPGLGVILNRDGWVVAARGSVSGTSAERLAEVFGAIGDTPEEAEQPELGLSCCVHRYELPTGYVLLIAVPREVTVRPERVGRAVALLERMLVAGPLPMDSGGPGDSGSGAPALVGLEAWSVKKGPSS